MRDDHIYFESIAWWPPPPVRQFAPYRTPWPEPAFTMAEWAWFNRYSTKEK